MEIIKEMENEFRKKLEFKEGDYIYIPVKENTDVFSFCDGFGKNGKKGGKITKTKNNRKGEIYSYGNPKKYE